LNCIYGIISLSASRIFSTDIALTLLRTDAHITMANNRIRIQSANQKIYQTLDLFLTVMIL